MSTETNEKKVANNGFGGWRKVCAWLLGAALLAVVGYRGALGTRAEAATPPLPASAEPDRAPQGDAAAITSASAGASTAASASATAAPAPPASASAKADGAEAPSPAITADGKVILNLATEVELRKLPGIGKARAQAILALRDRLKKFKRVEDLLRVKGIGVRRLAALKPKVVLDAP